MLVLIVEPKREIAEHIGTTLALSSVSVLQTSDFGLASQWSNPENLAAIVVDVGPDAPRGTGFIRDWRARAPRAPIVAVSDSGDWQDKVASLDAGADDYIVKPYRAEEFVARLQALMRRSKGEVTPSLRNGPLAVNPSARSATLGGAILELTGTEYRLLYLFLSNPNATLSLTEIARNLYRHDPEVRANTVAVHVGRLRKKVGSDAIINIRGIGYRMPRMTDDTNFY
jgi:DNA-binding response OmpR family regulator